MASQHDFTYILQGLLPSALGILNSEKFNNLSKDTQIGSDAAWSGSYH